MGKKFVRQHIVPQAYLKRFADKRIKKRGKGKDDYIIGVRDINGKIYEQNIKQIGYIKNYYDVEYLDNPKKWEHFYGENIDVLYGKPLERIIAKITLSQGDKINFTSEEKAVLSKIIISQWLRVPDNIDEKIKYSKLFFNDYKKAFLKVNEKLLTKSHKRIVKNIEFTDNQIKDIILSTINEDEHLEKYCEFLYRKNWIIYINPFKDLPYITCDNPIVTLNILEKTAKRDKNGLGLWYTVIYFPITSKIAIMIYPNFDSYEECYENNCIRTMADEEFIVAMNYNLSLQMYKQTFLPIEFLNGLKSIKDDNKNKY